jgi:HPt (histidine-containing phosphotransfer) domain-containing protein
MIAARSTHIYVTEDKRVFDGEEGRVLDLVHLARQTDGDATLEAELLAMFDCQAAKLSARLALPEVGFQAKSDIAHRLRGSALAIGARRVAAAAEATEAHFAALVGGGADQGDPLPELQAAIVEARAAIAQLGV